MNTMVEFFQSSWVHTLGYTLLHSVWQAFVIVSIIIIILRFVPSNQSNARYLIASLGLLVITTLSIGTFIYRYAGSNNSTFSTAAAYQNDVMGPLNAVAITTIGQYFTLAKTFIQSSIPFFVMAWVLGTFLFSLRILTGLVFVEKLRQQSVLLQNEWSQRIQKLAQQLNINRMILLAESSVIEVPVVIGYLKPMILIPIGMSTSLSTEQLESIFLHELMHIRRKDYLINLLQAFVEAVYFFNPFVWIISGLMKREREHCCDDAVVQLHGNPTAYAHALATLEEVRLSKAGLSLSLAENKNHLLNRIKRIMKKSAKNYSSTERIIPALLLVIGLICASWISNKSNGPEMRSEMTHSQTVLSDTTKKDKKARMHKKSTAKAKNEGVDLKKEPKQEGREITENKSDEDYDLDLSIELETDHAMKFNQGAFPVPDVDLDVPMPDIAVMAPLMMHLDLNLEHLSGPGFYGSDGRDWEKFAEEFEENFKSKFGDFYEKNGDAIQQMIEEAQEKVNSKFDDNWEMKMQEFARKQEEWAKNNAEKWEHEALKFSQRHEEQIKKSQENIKRWEEHHQKEFEKNRQQFEQRMKAFEEKNKRFEEELKRELIKDGYLSEDEKLEKMHWHNGKIEINDKKIKAEDEKKYNDIHEKYFRSKDFKNLE